MNRRMLWLTALLLAGFDLSPPPPRHLEPEPDPEPEPEPEPIEEDPS